MTPHEQRGPRKAGPGNVLGGDVPGNDIAAPRGRKRPFIAGWRSAVLNSTEASSVKITLLALAEFAGVDGGNCYPGVDALALLASQNEKTCRRSLKVAEGRWFTRAPAKFKGRDWKGYAYQLILPGAADTMPVRGRELADTMPAPQAPSSGHFGSEVRTLCPRAAGTMPDELERATSKSNKSKSAREEKEHLTLPTWLATESWDAWKSHRGKKFTAKAQKLALGKLELLRSEGHDPVKLINLAIESGWSSFYPRRETLAHPGTAAVGRIERDERPREEIDSANEAELDRWFGTGEAA